MSTYLEKIKDLVNTRSPKAIPTLVKKDNDLYEHLNQFYGDSLNEKVYNFLYPDQETCTKGQKRTFFGLNQGYGFCGKKNVCECAKQNQSTKISKYHQNKTQQEKQNTINKAKKTFLENHGVENPMWNQEIKEKHHQINLERHGALTPFESKEIQEKVKKTNLEKYGVERPFESFNIVKKAHKTARERYGDDFPKIARDKFLEQNENKNPFVVYKHKVQNSLFYNYGVEHPKKSSKIKQRSIDTLYLNYSVRNPSQIYIDKISFDILENPETFQLYCENYSLKELSQLLKVSEKTIWSRHDCYNLSIYKRSSRSQYEEEIAEWLNTLNVNYQRNKYIHSKTVDFLIDNTVALEFNGLFAHSEHSFYGKKLGIDRNYHFNKFQDCKDQNIQLFTIFEDEWNTKKQVVKNKIKIALGLGSKGISGRKTSVNEIDYSTAKKFLDCYHLQNGVKSTIYLGAFCDNDLVGVMCFLYKNKGVWELTRFSSDFEIHPGVFSKMLNYFQKNCSWDIIESFSDNRWSWGKIYEKHNFEYKKFVKPDYFVTNYRVREHKFNWRKNRMKSRFGIDTLHKTELELTKDLGWDRIWDCGKMKWILKK